MHLLLRPEDETTFDLKTVWESSCHVFSVIPTGYVTQYDTGSHRALVTLVLERSKTEYRSFYQKVEVYSDPQVDDRGTVASTVAHVGIELLSIWGFCVGSPGRKTGSPR